MKNFSINGRHNVRNTKEISIDYDGNNYLVIYGSHVNGGFFSIPNWKCGGELSDWDNFSDTLWNTQSINRSLKRKNASEVIAEAIKLNEQINVKS